MLRCNRKFVTTFYVLFYAVARIMVVYFLFHTFVLQWSTALHLSAFSRVAHQ